MDHEVYLSRSSLQYSNISMAEQAKAESIEAQTKAAIICLVKGHYNCLTNVDKVWFKFNFKHNRQTQQFYMLMKVHKDPIAICPVKSCIGHFLRQPQNGSATK